ncbi:hypothetical protein MTO96_018644 [Rhipicephalus appendiculatus]
MGSDHFPIFTNIIGFGTAGRHFCNVTRWGHVQSSAGRILWVRVEFYVNENTLKERLHLYFIKNQRSSLRIRVIRLVVKIVACLLYVGRVALDRGPRYATCYQCPLRVQNTSRYTDEAVRNGAINWDAIFWVERPFVLWCIQVCILNTGASFFRHSTIVSRQMIGLGVLILRPQGSCTVFAQATAE